MINDLIGEIHRLGFQVNKISEYPADMGGGWGIMLFRVRDQSFSPWLRGPGILDAICAAIGWAMENG